MENICHIPDWAQAFPFKENGWLNLVLKLAYKLGRKFNNFITGTFSKKPIS